jgi:hypothetical protein
MKSKKLSALMFGEEKSILEFKDRLKFNEIYEEYLQGHFISVVNMINDYGEFLFFKDLALFLKTKYRSEILKTSVYWHIYNLYFEELNITL